MQVLTCHGTGSTQNSLLGHLLLLLHLLQLDELLIQPSWVLLFAGAPVIELLNLSVVPPKAMTACIAKVDPLPFTKPMISIFLPVPLGPIMSHAFPEAVPTKENLTKFLLHFHGSRQQQTKEFCTYKKQLEVQVWSKTKW